MVSEADQRGMRTREGWGPERKRGGGLTLTHQSLLQTLTTCTQQSEHGRSLRAVSGGGEGWGKKREGGRKEKRVKGRRGGGRKEREGRRKEKRVGVRRGGVEDNMISQQRVNAQNPKVTQGCTGSHIR